MDQRSGRERRIRCRDRITAVRGGASRPSTPLWKTRVDTAPSATVISRMAIERASAVNAQSPLVALRSPSGMPSSCTITSSTVHSSRMLAQLPISPTIVRTRSRRSLLDPVAGGSFRSRAASNMAASRNTGITAATVASKVSVGWSPRVIMPPTVSTSGGRVDAGGRVALGSVIRSVPQWDEGTGAVRPMFGGRDVRR